MRIKDTFKEDYRGIRVGSLISLALFILLTYLTVGGAIDTVSLFSKVGIIAIGCIILVSAFPLLLSIARHRGLRKTVKYSIVSIPGAPFLFMLIFMLSTLVSVSRDAGGAGGYGDLLGIMFGLGLAFVVPPIILVIGILNSKIKN